MCHKPNCRSKYRTVVGFLFVFVFGLVSGIFAFAQQVPSSPEVGPRDAVTSQPSYTFRVTTREVVVDVIATDRHNHPLNDLRESDFQIFEVAGHSRKSLQASAFHVIDPALASHDLDAGSAGFRVTLGGGCAEQMAVHYQLAYHPSSEGWSSGYHDILVSTNRRDTKLSFRHRYYVGATDAPVSPQILSEKAQDALLQEAACYHLSTPLSISLSARLIETARSDSLRYFITVNADSLAFISLKDQTRRVQLDYGICTFDAESRALRYMHTSAERLLSSGEYVQALVHGFPNRLEFPRLADPALVRFVVRDRETGNVGALDVVISAPESGELTGSEKVALEGWMKYAKAHRTDDIKSHPPLGPIGSFGSMLPRPGSLCGDVYELPEGTEHLPNFWNMGAVGALHAFSLNVPPQEFWNTGGIPGMTRRTEWFGIDYYGVFWVKTPGEYQFEITSDDGARLYIDDDMVIDLDGQHQSSTKRGRVVLDVGRHTIHLPYFQGPIAVALVLTVKPPQSDFELFDVRNYPPPLDIK